jgi:hypothetical protein
LNETIGDWRIHAKNDFEAQKKVAVKILEGNNTDGAKFLAGVEVQHRPKLRLDLTRLSDMVSHAYASSDGSESISSICTRRSVNVCVDNSRDFFRALFRCDSEAPVSGVTSRVSADQALLAAAASTSSPELG